jgi:hypothetical protein
LVNLNAILLVSTVQDQYDVQTPVRSLHQP